MIEILQMTSSIQKEYKVTASAEEWMSHVIAAAWTGHSVFLKPHISAAMRNNNHAYGALSSFFCVPVTL
jgi:hypothetical protein